MITASGINFTPKSSVKLSVTDASASVTFSALTPPFNSNRRQTFCVYNGGASDAFISGGYNAATAAVSTTTPAANCHCIGAGTVQVIDLLYLSDPSNPDLVTNTIAAICATGESTTLEISIGYGQ